MCMGAELSMWRQAVLVSSQGARVCKKQGLLRCSLGQAMCVPVS